MTTQDETRAAMFGFASGCLHLARNGQAERLEEIREALLRAGLDQSASALSEYIELARRTRREAERRAAQG